MSDNLTEEEKADMYESRCNAERLYKAMQSATLQNIRNLLSEDSLDMEDCSRLTVLIDRAISQGVSNSVIKETIISSTNTI